MCISHIFHNLRWQTSPFLVCVFFIIIIILHSGTCKHIHNKVPLHSNMLMNTQFVKPKQSKDLYLQSATMM